MKLSTAQQRALDKLTDEWQSADKLQESFTTLRALIRKGLVESGTSFFDPKTIIGYRRV